MNYSAYDTPRPRRWARPLLIVFVLLTVGLVIGGWQAYRWYDQNLQPVGTSEQSLSITIEQGSSIGQIADLLKLNDLIRNEWVFERYVQSQGLGASLQAGTYRLTQAMSVEQIVTIITSGEVEDTLLTIVPGARIDQIRDLLASEGYTETEINSALAPASYLGHPVAVHFPDGLQSLEGFIYPESFFVNSQTTAQDFIRQALDQMNLQLTADVIQGMQAQGLTVYEGVILASILEQELVTAADRQQAAQVFLTRMERGIALESDATAPYGAVLAGQEPSLTFTSAYNTYQNPGLPPTPISNVSAVSLAAVASPSQTDWLYFVSGDDGTTYFSRTLAEHEANTIRYCTTLCGR